MTEEQIKDGYARLDGALAPPMDVAERVQRRVGARRRRRRTTMVAGTLVAVVAVGGGVVAATSGDDGPRDTVAVDQPAGPVSTLVLTRPDGSTYAFPDVTVSCEPPRTAAGDPVAQPPGRIWMYSPINVTGTEKDDDARVVEPFVYFEGIVAKLQGDRTFDLPIWGPGDSETYPLTLFMADTVGPNEVASSTESSGTVRVLRASCDPVPVLELEVDATLGSEVSLSSLDITGTLR